LAGRGAALLRAKTQAARERITGSLSLLRLQTSAQSPGGTTVTASSGWLARAAGRRSSALASLPPARGSEVGR